MYTMLFNGWFKGVLNAVRNIHQLHRFVSLLFLNLQGLNRDKRVFLFFRGELYQWTGMYIPVDWYANETLAK